MKPCFDLWGHAPAARYRAVPALDEEGRLWLLADRAADPLLLQVLRQKTGRHVGWKRCDTSEVDRWLTEGERGFRALEGLEGDASEVSHPADAPDLSLARMASESSPAIRLLDAVMFDALQEGASDIHIESHPRGADVRLRVDGVLRTVRHIEGDALSEQIVSRLKVISELDIGERRLPQDGRFKLRLQGRREVDFRVSIIPSVHGEDAVVRVLDRTAVQGDAGTLTLASLGFDGPMRESMLALARRPHGMVLVTGPTGSGKTTTLYALITETQSPDEKIITVEDPVEYRLPGVVQIPVNDKKGLTFALGLRSILRHDPDRVMVGEIRDSETAQIAVQAALTGHLVFSTVHANSAFDVIGRFMHMGLDLYNVVAALEAVVAQRLVRQVCQACVARGCSLCGGSGYKGRRALAEVLHLDDDLRDCIAARAPMSQIKQTARALGMQPLAMAARQAVQAGWTTQEEVNRVVVDA